MKFHFVASILFVITLSFLAINKNLNTRMLLLVPVLVLFYATIIFFGLEYEKEKQALWQKRQKKLVEETYERFFKNKKN